MEQDIQNLIDRTNESINDIQHYIDNDMNPNNDPELPPYTYEQGQLTALRQLAGYLQDILNGTYEQVKAPETPPF